MSIILSFYVCCFLKLISLLSESIMVNLADMFILFEVYFIFNLFDIIFKSVILIIFDNFCFQL